MRGKNEQQHLFDKPHNVNLLFRVFYSACIILLALDFVIHRHTEHSWEQLPGFFAIFGFVACVTLVLIAKQLRRLLKRREDYYDVDE